MKTEITDVFTRTAGRILETMTAVKVVQGKIASGAPAAESRGVTSVIRLSGDMEGRVLIDMDRRTAQAVASCMNRTEVEPGNDMVVSTINELANIISGQAVTELMNRKCRLKISSPKVFTGSLNHESDGFDESVRLDFETELGDIVLEIDVNSRRGRKG
jgi:chemotaxis protein CheX